MPSVAKNRPFALPGRSLPKEVAQISVFAGDLLGFTGQLSNGKDFVAVRPSPLPCHDRVPSVIFSANGKVFLYTAPVKGATELHDLTSLMAEMDAAVTKDPAPSQRELMREFYPLLPRTSEVLKGMDKKDPLNLRGLMAEVEVIQATVKTLPSAADKVEEVFDRKISASSERTPISTVFYADILCL